MTNYCSFTPKVYKTVYLGVYVIGWVEVLSRVWVSRKFYNPGSFITLEPGLVLSFLICSIAQQDIALYFSILSFPPNLWFKLMKHNAWSKTDTFKN